MHKVGAPAFQHASVHQRRQCRHGGRLLPQRPPPGVGQGDCPLHALLRHTLAWHRMCDAMDPAVRVANFCPPRHDPDGVHYALAVPAACNLYGLLHQTQLLAHLRHGRRLGGVGGLHTDSGRLENLRRLQQALPPPPLHPRQRAPHGPPRRGRRLGLRQARGGEQGAAVPLALRVHGLRKPGVRCDGGAPPPRRAHAAEALLQSPR
mmetsp:Transcript_94323/g.281469  ORF Transcript_94323/g.281469 Transcript_94323/m.281469 type:complete len:206 (+) Transcript_94323:158-775(+)